MTILSLHIQTFLKLQVLLLLTLITLDATANPYQAVCEKVANNDITELEIIPINSPKDAKIDLNNDGVYDTVSCSNSCYFDDGVTGEHIGTVGPDGWGKDDYGTVDVFKYDGKTFIRGGVGTREQNAPSNVMMFIGM